MVLTSNLRSIFWLLSWSLCFSIMMAITRYLSGCVSAPMIVLTRLTLGFFYFLPIVLKTGILNMRTAKLRLHAFRVVLTVTSMTCTYYAYSHLPLATATSIGFIAPMMTTVLSILIFKENVSARHWCLILLGYLGVVIIVRPGYAMPDDVATISIAVAANFFASCSFLLMKRLSKTETVTQIMFWTNLISMIILLAASPWFWKAPQMHEMLWLMLLGFVGVISQFSYAKAISYGTPSVIAPFEYSRLVFAVPLGIVFFGEALSLWTICGSLVIIVANTTLAVLRKDNT